ncbi:MAG: ATP-binding protein [Candidatus Eisenbacteria sp.]|nr:ATP-binding protein [Candidatus Eisenbacteria bacterium]
MIRDILLTQRRELERRLHERYVERDFDLQQPSDHLIRVVLGPRRAGKSFFAMRQVQSTGHFGYVNFDDERLTELDDYDALITALDALYERPRHLLLDEVQNVPRWELLVNRLQRQGYRLVVTGSNAHLLSSELATHLTGRHIPIVLFPFTYAEHLRSLDAPLTDQEKAQALRTYIENGGYPEPLMKGIPYRDYLTILLRSILYKDVVVRHRIRSPQGLEDLTTYLMTNVAQRYSLNTLAKVTRLRSVHTVEKYLRHLEEAFVLFSLRRFSFKVREQVRANRKIYCTDNGLVTSSSFRFSPDLGKLYENAVAITLRRHEMDGKIECFYWQGSQQEEVDFVVKQGTRIVQLIQVCIAVEAPKTKARETRALLKASSELGCKDLVVLTDSTEAEEEASWYGTAGRVRYVPVWKWLLANSTTLEAT